MYAFARYVLMPTICLLLCIRKYRERCWGKCQNNVKLDGKVAVVTGANSGIGYEITKELANRGALVIMACRDLNKAAAAMYKMKREIQTTSVIIPMELDLASVESIKNFSDEIAATYQEIHLLVNNAGVSYPRNIKESTKDGLEIHFGVNYFGHFLLTHLLLDQLRNAASSRVIIVSSMLYEKGTLYLDDLNLERIAEKTDGYANSKLANVYFCRELAKRLQRTNVKVFAVCPGWVYTNLFRHHVKWYHFLISLPMVFLFMRTSNQGAQTAIYCATQPSLQSGCIYKDCDIYNSKIGFDVTTSKCLWYRTVQILEQIERSLKLGLFLDDALL